MKPPESVADEATVENVMVAVPFALLLIVTGLPLPNEQVACEAVNVTVEVTAQDSVTMPV